MGFIQATRHNRGMGLEDRISVTNTKKTIYTFSFYFRDIFHFLIGVILLRKGDCDEMLRNVF